MYLFQFNGWLVNEKRMNLITEEGSKLFSASHLCTPSNNLNVYQCSDDFLANI